MLIETIMFHHLTSHSLSVRKSSYPVVAIPFPLVVDARTIFIYIGWASPYDEFQSHFYRLKLILTKNKNKLNNIFRLTISLHFPV